MTSTSPEKSPNLLELIMENSLIMGEILCNLPFVDIQRLRRVSCGIRNCVDDIQPDPNIKEYSLIITSSYVSADIRMRDSHKVTSIRYYQYYYQCNNGKRSYVQIILPYETNRNTNFDGENFKNMALHDFENTLSHQKKCLEELSVNTRVLNYFQDQPHVCDFCAQLGKILKKRKSPLKVEKLAISPLYQECAIQILTGLDPSFLKKITIVPVFPQGSGEEKFKVEQICETEQWKNAEELLIWHCTVATPIQNMNITHLSKLDIRVEDMSTDDVIFLKTELLQSKILEKFEIDFVSCSSSTIYTDVLGSPHDHNRLDIICNFPMVNDIGFLLKLVLVREKVRRATEYISKKIIFSQVPNDGGQ